MTREQQRELGALAMSVGNMVADDRSTKIATIHCAADLMQNLAAEVEIFRDYDAKQRRRLASEGRAMPDGSFPIVDASDAEIAIEAVGRAKDVPATKSFIRRRVSALRCSGPIFENWK